MAMGKRQLVLAALVVALGAAVYLNWVFTGNGSQLPATQAVTSAASRQYGQTLMVGGSAVSSGKAVSSGAGKSVSSAGKTAVSSAQSKSGTTASASSAPADDYFSQAKLTREKAQDEAKETIAQVMEDTKATDAAKKEAATQVAALAQNLIREANIETLIRAKGFEDCVVTLGNDRCTVVVKTKQNSENDAAVIQDIVTGQTGLSYDKISITERS